MAPPPGQRKQRNAKHGAYGADAVRERRKLRALIEDTKATINGFS